MPPAGLRHPRDILADPGSSLAQLQRALTAMEADSTAPPGGLRPKATRMGISSNVTMDLLALYLKRYASIHGITLSVEPVHYDDLIGDMERFVEQGAEYILLLPFFDNLLPGLEARLPVLTPEELAATETALRRRYRLAFARGAGLKQIFLCGMHAYGRQAADGFLSETIRQFNRGLREEAADAGNVRWIETRELIEGLGRAAAFDARFYFRAKAPYTPALLDGLAQRVSSMTRGFGSYYYKVLVLDCDNTLWGGILGEVLMDGIRLDPHSYPGNIFWRVQQQLLALERSGVLLCLCSRNNSEDVDAVLTEHPHMVLRNAHFALKRVNWQDKVENLRELASELNLGLDSFVLLDDSEFECAAVRAQLPMVHTILVPPSLPDYPSVVENVADLFLAGTSEARTGSKTELYHRLRKAKDLEAKCETREAYLASLGLKLVTTRDRPGSVARLSDLTCKSNQFNLTTRRYTDNELLSLVRDPEFRVYALAVTDIFGDAGMTGAAIVRYQDQTMTIDAFLLSCRVLGRGLEYAPWPYLIRDAVDAGMTLYAAAFLPTERNIQVSRFYDQLGMKLTREENGSRFYHGELASLTVPLTPWIEVIHAGRK